MFQHLRSLAFSLWFYAVSTLLTVFGQPLGLLWPKALPAYGRAWAGLVLAGLPLCGIRVSVTGRENLPASGPMLIASTHQSAFETILWLRLVPYARYVIKIELSRIPLFGWLCVLTGQIPVDRQGGGAALRGLLRKAGDALAAGGQVIIFPEGTRAPAGKLNPLQPGVAAIAGHSGLGVIPVVTDSGFCWGKGPFGKRAGTIHVHIMPALPAGMPRAALMQALQTSYQEGLRDLSHTDRPVENSVHEAAPHFPA